MATNGQGERVPGWSFGAIGIAIAAFALLPFAVASPEQAVTTASPSSPTPTAPPPSTPAPSTPPSTAQAPPPTSAPTITLADELEAFDASIPQTFLTDLQQTEPVFRELLASTTADQFRSRAATASTLVTRMVRVLDAAVTGQILGPKITALTNALGGVAMGLQAVSTCSGAACDRSISVLEAAGGRLERAANDLLALYNSTPS